MKEPSEEEKLKYWEADPEHGRTSSSRRTTGRSASSIDPAAPPSKAADAGGVDK